MFASIYTVIDMIDLLTLITHHSVPHIIKQWNSVITNDSDNYGVDCSIKIRNVFCFKGALCHF